jgi:hypothetical protein
VAFVALERGSDHTSSLSWVGNGPLDRKSSLSGSGVYNVLWRMMVLMSEGYPVAGVDYHPIPHCLMSNRRDFLQYRPHAPC